MIKQVNDNSGASVMFNNYHLPELGFFFFNFFYQLS